MVTETNGNDENFLDHMQHPRFASGYDQKQLIKTDVDKKKHRVVPKLMNTVPN